MVLIIVIIAIALLLGIAGWFWCEGWSYPYQVYRRAKDFEGSGEFEDAVYCYGWALYNYYPRPEDCRGKIRELWATYGPFEFSATREEFAQHSDIDRDGRDHQAGGRC